MFSSKAALLLVVLLGCSASELTAGGHRVVYSTSMLDVSGCTKLGEVESSGASNPRDSQARTVAMHELRNAAAEKGGTHVLVDENAPADLSKGVAYKCP